MHGGDIYSNKVDIDFSVSLNPCKRNLSEDFLIKQAVSEGMRSFGNYPELSQYEVRRALSMAEGVPYGCVYGGNGASELIMGITGMVSPKKALIMEPGYSGYLHALRSVKECQIISCYLKEKDGFMLTEEVLDYITDDIDMIFIQDPWNPVGVNNDSELIKRLIRKSLDHNITILFDISFRSLSEGAARDLSIHDNIYYVSSFTKSFAMPGIRMGYVMSTETNINDLIQRLPEWNLSSMAQSVMKACARISAEGDYPERSVSFIRKEREFLTKELEGLGFKVYRSDTVFILFRDTMQAAGRQADLHESLLKRRILIRKCDDLPGLGKDFFRTGIRGHEENIMLIDNIKEVLYGA